MVDKIKKCSLLLFPAVWGIVNSCSEWLVSQGMCHWKNYYTPEIVKDKILETSVFGLFSEDILKGVVSLSLKMPSYYLQGDIQNSNDKALYLGMLAVSPEHQKKGLASKLMVFSEEIAKREDVQVIRLMHFSTYEKLKQFYLKQGYDCVRTRDDDRDLMDFCEKKI